MFIKFVFINKSEKQNNRYFLGVRSQKTLRCNKKLFKVAIYKKMILPVILLTNLILKFKIANNNLFTGQIMFFNCFIYLLVTI